MRPLYALTFDDLVTGVSEGDLSASGAVQVPNDLCDLPADRLRFVQGSIVDGAAYTRFHIDAAGLKHVIASDERQPLDCPWDAKLLHVDGEWTVAGEVDRINAVKRHLQEEIDIAAEAVRLRYITAGAGQAMVYQRKGEEARRFAAWRADNALPAMPEAGSFPILEASVGIEGDTIDVIASLVASMEGQWLWVAAQIERERLSTKAEIAAAATEAGARAARAAVVWP